MKFSNVSEAFNHYRTATIEQIETRAAEIKGAIETNPEADVMSLNVEIQGLEQAKKNIQEKADTARRAANLTEVESRSFTRGADLRKADDVTATPEYRSAFFKQLTGRDMSADERRALEIARSEKRADAFSTTTDTAAVIPTETLNEVVSKARKMGGVMSLARGFAVPANLTVPVGTPAAAASWHTEGATVDADKPGIAAVTFSPHEIIKVFSISASVKRMSVPAFESYLTDELAACVMACIADALVNGTGTAQGTGIVSGIEWGETNSVEYTKDGAATYADVVKAMALLKRGYSNGAAWVMNNATLYSQFYSIVDGNDRPIFIQDAQNDHVGRILGFPVVIDDYMADGDALFGNFAYAGYNLAEGIAIERSDQSSFRSGKVDYRALAIADCKPIVDEAFVKLCEATA